MPRRLPPLTALRAFEAAGRNLSFTKASQELMVTQSAVSRQIQLLEKTLRTQLFRRMTRKVELTAAGEQYFVVVERALDDIEAATLRLKRELRRRVLRLSVLPTISVLWLMPRLAAFSQQEDETEVRIINSIEPVDFQAKGADLAIRVGRVPGETYGRDNPRIELEMVTNWRGVHSEPLFRDVLTPVCSPDLLAERPVENVAGLSRHRLIHVTTRRYAWHDWLRAHGGTFDPDRNALYFGHFFMAMEAARAGEGFAIVPTVLLRPSGGSLVRPLAADLPSAGRYYLLFHESRAADPTIRRFKEWLLHEAASEPIVPASG